MVLLLGGAVVIADEMVSSEEITASRNTPHYQERFGSHAVRMQGDRSPATAQDRENHLLTLRQSRCHGLFRR